MSLLHKFLFLILLFTAGKCFCQDENDSNFVGTLSISYLQLDAGSEKTATLPFTGVNIIDGRFDTSCVGFAKNSFISSTKKLALIDGVAGSLARYITKNYVFANNRDSAGNLTIVIEKIWLTSSYLPGKKEHGDLPAQNEITLDPSQNRGEQRQACIYWRIVY